MRDHERRAALHETLDRLLHEPLALAVERRGRLVENEDRRVLEDGAGERDTLPLTATELHSALAHMRVVAGAALQRELGKIGAGLQEENDAWTLTPSSSLPQTAMFNTYKDHRMAMAFAPLSTLMDVEIENPAVVRKSYPKFWDDMRLLGFDINSRQASGAD